MSVNLCSVHSNGKSVLLANRNDMFIIEEKKEEEEDENDNKQSETQ